MAKKTEDLRAYWQELATKQGVDPDTISAMSEALGNPTVEKAFRQAFVPVPDHHSRLDETKAEYASRKAELDEWYANTALPAYQTNLGGIDKLHQYESVYGPLDPANTTRSDATALGFNSKADLDKYLDDRFKAERAGYVGLVKTIPRMSVDYFNRFKEVLDPDEVEKISIKMGLPPDLAYREYIAPKVEEQRKAEFETKLKEAHDAGFREARTSVNLPADSTPRESSPFYERITTPDPKNMTEPEQDKASRNEFLDGWNNYAEIIANKHRPA
jgi:hypothetical protein